MLTPLLKLKTLYWRKSGSYSLRVTLNDTRTELAIPKELKRRIDENDSLVWKGDRDLFQGKGSVLINEEMQKIRKAITLTFALMQGAGYEPSAGVVVNTYKDILKNRYSFSMEGIIKCMREKEIQRAKLSMMDLLNWYMSSAVTEKRTKIMRQTLVNNLRKFLISIDQADLPADLFTIAVAYRFIDWLRQRRPEVPLKDNYINMHLILIKSAISAGYVREKVCENRLLGFNFKFTRDEHTDYLSQEQLDELAGMDLSQETRSMQVARDLFLFCCYTSFHYVDREGLKDEHLYFRDGHWWIEKVRQKTKRFKAKAHLKLHPEAMRIIQKYGGKLSMLPHLEYGTNWYTLRKLGKKMGLGFNLTTGIARNTFAHKCLNEWKRSLEATAAQMGLKDTGTIKKYASAGRSRVDLEVNWDDLGHAS